ncbi:ArsR family transcriptional regulator [Streptomyces albospinus]|uniref:ArsR family transcriptional regulator n=1 Tax=Streptomyces albospinus TaxID=285515 RepID=A0ABQ2UNB8_9ACTN|nr:winged helix-turn-helix domain-containing protein [Streptomyces albospinus]GGU46211.1 ArsR family transcriptional regulator [Streptomyces albospinus]
MSTLRLSPLALSRSRFALSPLAETIGTTIALARPHPDPWFAAWRARHLPAFTAALDADPFARGLTGLISSTKWLPGFVAVPPPDGMRTTLTRELAAVRAVSDDTFRAELEPSLTHSWHHHDLDWLSGHGWGPRAADLLQALWTAHIAADWPRRRALLERDVAYRAGLLAAYGWPRALEQMSRHSTWVGADAIRFSNRPGPERVIGDDGMFFVPVSLSTGTWLCQGPPGHYAQVYPAGGAATALTPARPRRALERLIGAGRATILHELAHPATSTELAARLGQSLGTIGGHLSVLRDAGLVVGTRVGRRVVYRRTEDGDRLAGDQDT